MSGHESGLQGREVVIIEAARTLRGAWWRFMPRSARIVARATSADSARRWQLANAPTETSVWRGGGARWKCVRTTRQDGAEVLRATPVLPVAKPTWSRSQRPRRTIHRRSYRRVGPRRPTGLPACGPSPCARPPTGSERSRWHPAVSARRVEWPLAGSPAARSRFRLAPAGAVPPERAWPPARAA